MHVCVCVSVCVCVLCVCVCVGACMCGLCVHCTCPDESDMRLGSEGMLSKPSRVISMGTDEVLCVRSKSLLLGGVSGVCTS